MSPIWPTLADGAGGWRDPFPGPVGPRPAPLASIIAIRQCLIPSLAIFSPSGGSVLVKLQALPKREAP
jgi:hypothetical protein